MWRLFMRNFYPLPLGEGRVRDVAIIRKTLPLTCPFGTSSPKRRGTPYYVPVGDQRTLRSLPKIIYTFSRRLLRTNLLHLYFILHHVGKYSSGISHFLFDSRLTLFSSSPAPL